MVRSKPSGRSSKKAIDEGSQTLAWMRTLALSQWRGAYAVPAPNRNIYKASEHVDSLLESVGITPGQDEESIKNAWVSAAGDFVAKQTSVGSFRNGVLVIHTVQPALKFNLDSMKGMILKKLKEELGSNTVRSVVFRVG